MSMDLFNICIILEVTYMIAALCLFFALLAAPSLEEGSESRLTSPCPGVFRYEPPVAESNRWYGVVTLSTNNTLHSLWLNIVLDDRADILGNWFGYVTTSDNKNFKIENSDVLLKPGRTLRVRFFVTYGAKRPRLLAIRLNGRDICTAADAHDDRNYPAYNNKNSGLPEPLDRHIDAALRQLITSPESTNPKGPDGKPQCGKVVPKKMRLDGKPSLDTLWPWQIALYRDENGTSKCFCGGTLVSARHVITAAHCVTKWSTVQVVELYTLSLFLGKHNLWDTHDEAQVRYVQTIIVHPQYNAYNYTHNVAILELNKPVRYSYWIKPACLWPEHYTDLKKGVLLSWRFIDKERCNNDLTQEEVPIVSQETCNRSHERFERFTSEYTYCAGNRNETALCPQSGSGMVVKIGSTWYLRGLTSLALPGFGNKRCDTTNYIIYTDLAKYLPWIEHNIFDF